MPDGRNTRWEAHRRARRAELVDAALIAIRRHGPAVGMDEVAEVAGTSKTALYRHFSDKSQLYLAVCTRVAETLLSQLREVLRPGVGGRAALRAGIDAYLQLIESDPQVYQFVVHHPALDRPVDDDPFGGLVQLIGDRVAAVLEPRLRQAGLDPAVALPWGYGLVGLVRAAADPWLEGRVNIERVGLRDDLTELLWGGLAPFFTTGSKASTASARRGENGKALGA